MFTTLTPSSKVEYRFDGTNFIVRQPGSGPGPEPYPLNASKRSIPSYWTKSEDGWIMRTIGTPSTVTKLLNHFEEDAKKVAAQKNNIDWKIFIVQSACEAAPSRNHSSGKNLLSPRTEIGYPNRKGENDPGDPDRDAVDGGRHCSFGLCQTLLSTARFANPELFKGIPLKAQRYVLGVPKNSFSALASYYWTLPESTRKDPLRVRTAFGAGGVYKSEKNVWGVRCYDVSVIDHFLAFWGDLACVLSERP